MIISVPDVIYLHSGEYTISISVLPTKTEGEVIEILKSTMKISECRDKLLCYPRIFGGIFIFLRKSVLSRIEFDGYLCQGKEGELFDVNKFHESLKNDFSCFKFDNGKIYCFSRVRKYGECKAIDNIGLRFIVD
ncbi:hypothetical protein [Acidianus ambivalens]|uniref:Uncharacterized protein n=1 Tax=Acidianus ambivalens TaxID=2283 RepID=A0A650CVX9_ACIAM|nr:hypothetical protein [Acidianus ambivalens]MQL55835.1 hypothetical protein [Acidianus ambivalens]QGR21597.1 hypothetical protein D1866_06020 [Acidianus ambivalens]